MYMLNSKTESIKINDKEIRKIMKVKKKKLEGGQIIELDNEEREKEKKEEEKEEKEKEEKKKKKEEREAKYENKVIFTGQSIQLRSSSPATYSLNTMLMGRSQIMRTVSKDSPLLPIYSLLEEYSMGFLLNIGNEIS
ncbi:hypothetical protein Glove_203g96 [Diversispora epigaea]|uniref:Uncharacterized protein n=1 Tax=Diversispora epigaea TaxID=1348612 RepID=A0A397ITY5_9GLOM|nr:hypothetical protein Glove_203g96 [Diversispora epigaea]